MKSGNSLRGRGGGEGPPLENAATCILGLDPGTRVTGWGVIRGDRRTIVSTDFGCLRPPRAGGRPRALAFLAENLATLLERTTPDVVVVETPFAARHLRAALALAETRGAILATLGRWGGEVVEYEPARVKAAVVGYGRAEKQQVAYMVQQRLQLPAPPAEDAADALALALCHLAYANVPVSSRGRV